MKKLFEKLRCWLICRLGGYTRQQVISEPHIHYVTRDICPVEFGGMAEIDPYTTQYRSDLSQRVVQFAMDQVAHEIAKELMKHRAINFSMLTYTLTNRVILRGTVLVMPGKEASFFQYYKPVQRPIEPPPFWLA